MTSSDELARWLKEVAGPEIDNVRLEVMHGGVGDLKEAAVWIVRNEM